MYIHWEGKLGMTWLRIVGKWVWPEERAEEGMTRDRACGKVVKIWKVLTCHKPFEDFILKLKEATEGFLAEKWHKDPHERNYRRCQ